MTQIVIAAPMYSFAPDRRRPWWRHLIQSLARQGRALAAERRRRLAIRRLRELDPRMLADIGLRRSEIEPAVRGGRSKILTGAI